MSEREELAKAVDDTAEDLDRLSWQFNEDADEQEIFTDAAKHLRDYAALLRQPAAPVQVSEAMVERGAALSTTGRANDPSYRAKIRRILEAALQAGVPGGWKLVPEEPTPEMLDRGADYTNPSRAHDVYTAMLAAAPTAAQE